MKIYKIKIFEMYYYLLLILISGIPLIFSIGLNTLRNYLTILSAILIVIFFPSYSKNLKNLSKFTHTYLWIIIFSIIYGIFIAYINYGYDVRDVFAGLRQYIWILLFMPLLFIVNNKEVNFNRILNGTVNVLLVSLFFRAISWSGYTFFRISIFSSFLYEYGDLWYRNETSIRVDGTPLITISTFLMMYLYLKERNIKYLYKLVAILLYIIFVNQTRMLLVSVLVSLLIMIVYSKDNISFWYKLLKRIAIVIVVIFITPYLIQYFGLSIDSIDYGLGYRYWELEYYTNLLLDGKWKTGLGILVPGNINSNLILYGPSEITKWYLDDLGFMELFVQFGLVAVPMYLIILYKLVNLYKTTKLQKINRAFMIALFLNLLITAVSLNVYGIQRSFSLAIIIMIMCYFDNRIKYGGNEDIG